MTVKRCPCGKRDQLRRGVCHACYERDRRAGRIPTLVAAGPARSHIILLRVHGWHYREIARAAGLDRSVVAWIMRGREEIQAKTARSLRAVEPTARAAYIKHGWDTRRAKAAVTADPEPVVIPAPGRWTDGALCAQVDYEIFFPKKGGENRSARRVCALCEVREPCLEFALENDISHGIFGGLSVRDRQRIRRTRAQEPPITA